MAKEISDKNIELFEEWMVRRGRSSETAALYGYMIGASGRDANVTARLLDRELAPKTRRLNLSALRAWARFAKDDELDEALSDIKLPPAMRRAAKHPMTIDALKAFVGHLAQSNIHPVSKAIVMIMIARGLRLRDALKIRRKDALAALRTGKLVYEQKGSSRREISVAPIREYVQTLVDYSSKWEEVVDCYGDLSFRAASQRVRRAVARVANKLELENVHPHGFRRTHAVNFLKRLENDPQALTKLQQYMGWTNISTAAMYTDSVNREELDDQGAEMMRDLLP